jgi:hypothetical protein
MMIFEQKDLALSAWQYDAICETINRYQQLTDSDELSNELKIDPTIEHKIWKAYFDDLDFQRMTSELDSMRNSDDRYFLKMSKKKQNEYLELWKKRGSYYQLQIIENRLLTGEQKKKGQEIQIMLMRYYPFFITPRMFNALDLSPEQQLKLNQICQKLKPEYEEYIDKFIEVSLSWQIDLANKIEESKFQCNSDFFNVQKVYKRNFLIGNEWQKLLRQKDQLIKKLEDDVSQILIDKQVQKLNELINNPHDSVKKCIKVLNERFNIKP